jgi:hypothetical protein
VVSASCHLPVHLCCWCGNAHVQQPTKPCQLRQAPIPWPCAAIRLPKVLPQLDM